MLRTCDKNQNKRSLFLLYFGQEVLKILIATLITKYSCLLQIFLESLSSICLPVFLRHSNPRYMCMYVMYGKLIASNRISLKVSQIKYIIVIMGDPSSPSCKTYSPNLPSTTTLDKKFLVFPYHLSSMLQLLRDYKITEYLISLFLTLIQGLSGNNTVQIFKFVKSKWTIFKESV